MLFLAGTKRENSKALQLSVHKALVLKLLLVGLEGAEEDLECQAEPLWLQNQVENLRKNIVLRYTQKLILDAAFTSNYTSPAEQTLLREKNLDTGTWSQPCS